MAGREGIVLLEVKTGKCVVHVTVVRLVGSDHGHHITPLGIVGQLPVLASDVWSGHVRPLGKLACINIVKQMRVGLDRLLFKVAHEAMAEPEDDEEEG